MPESPSKIFMKSNPAYENMIARVNTFPVRISVPILLAGPVRKASRWRF